MGKHDASDYEGKHVKDKDDWSWSWTEETRGGGSATGCLIPLALARVITLLRRNA